MTQVKSHVSGVNSENECYEFPIPSQFAQTFFKENFEETAGYCPTHKKFVTLRHGVCTNCCRLAED